MAVESSENVVVTVEPHPTLKYVGGLLGAIGGWLFLYFMMLLTSHFLGTKNLLIVIVMLILTICNLVGIFAYPILGFAIGYSRMFTIRRIRPK